MDNVKIVRLQSGEDIMAEFREDNGSGEVFLGSPMSVFYKRLPSGKALMLMSPWLPIELIENNHAYIFVSDILTVIQPKQVLINYYDKIVNETELDAIQTSKDIEESLSGEAQEYEMTGDSGDDMEEDASLEDMEFIKKQSKKHILH
jgi:hypothetical protein